MSTDLTVTQAKSGNFLDLTFDARQKVAELMAKSGFFPDVMNAAAAYAKLQIGAELGIPMGPSLSGIFITDGKPQLSAGLMAALIKKSKRYNFKVKTLTADVCELEFFERNNDGKFESVGLSSFTMEDARLCGALVGKNAHSYKKYPSDMLFARALSRGTRRFTPDVLFGVAHTPEDFDNNVIDAEVVSTGSAATRKPQLDESLPERPITDDEGKAFAELLGQTSLSVLEAAKLFPGVGEYRSANPFEKTPEGWDISKVTYRQYDLIMRTLLQKVKVS